MEKIPSAIKFFHDSKERDLFVIMQEFAKAHVKAALEAAAEKAIAKENPKDFGTGEIWVDEKSILNAYPDNLIS